MSQVGEISVKVDADTRGFKKGISETVKGTETAGARLKKLAKEAREVGNTMAKWAIGAGVALTGLAAKITTSSLKSTRELKNLSTVAGVSTAAFERMAFATRSVGVDQEKLSQIFLDMNDRVGDFVTSGAGPLVDFFEKIGPKVGVTIDQFKKLSGPEALQLFVSSLEKANVSQAEMSFFMESISGDATRLLPLLKNNGAAMREQAEAAKELGIGLSDIQVENAIKAQKALDDISGSLESSTSKIVADFAPALEIMAKDILEISKETGELSSTIFNMAKTGAKGVAILADGLHGIKVIVHALKPLFEGLKLLVIGIGSTIRNSIVGAMESVTNSIKGAGFAIGAINSVMGASFNGAIAKIDEFVKKARQGADITQQMYEDQKQIFAASTDEFNKIADPNLLPSKSIEAYIQKLEVALSKQAELNGAEKLKDFLPEPAANDGTGVSQMSVIESYNTETVGLLEAMGLRFQSQEEAQLAANARELEILDQQLANKQLSEQQYAEKVADIKRKSAELERGILKSHLQDGFKLLAENSSKVSKMMEGVAIYQAGVKGAQAAVDAWQSGMSAGGPWLAAAYTAASLAKTGQLIQNIRGGGKGAGGSVAPQAAQPPQQAQQSQSGQSGGQMEKTFNIKLVGQSQSSETVRELLGMINEEIGNGFAINT